MLFRKTDDDIREILKTVREALKLHHNCTDPDPHILGVISCLREKLMMKEISLRLEDLTCHQLCTMKEMMEEKPKPVRKKVGRKTKRVKKQKSKKSPSVA